MDFIMSFFIFSVVIVIFMHFIVNKSEESKVVQDQLLTDARIISNSLMLPGYPLNWDHTNVDRIGITDKNSKFNRTKLLEFQKLTYSEMRKRFDVPHDFMIFFEGDNRKSVPVFGVCSVGHPDMDLSSKRKIAYYTRNIEDAVLDPDSHEVYDDLDEMGITAVDTFCEEGHTKCNGLTAELENDLFDYDLLIVENGDLDLVPSFLSWAEKGLPTLLIGDFTTAGMMGMNVDHTETVGSTDAIMAKELPFLDLTADSMISMNHDYVVLTNNDPNVIVETYATSDEWGTGIMAWNYPDGTIYHFSSADILSPPDFYDQLKLGIYDLANHNCSKLDLSAVDYSNVVKLSRFLVKKNRVINMVILTWD